MYFKALLYVNLVVHKMYHEVGETIWFNTLECEIHYTYRRVYISAMYTFIYR